MIFLSQTCTIIQKYWLLLIQKTLHGRSELKPAFTETSCLASGFDMKLEDDDTECNHFTLPPKHTNCAMYLYNSFYFPSCMRESKHSPFVVGPAGAASKGPNEVSFKTNCEAQQDHSLKGQASLKCGVFLAWKEASKHQRNW